MISRTVLKTQATQSAGTLSGLLSGFTARGQQVRGSLETLGLYAEASAPTFAPFEALELVRVPDYGELVFRNRGSERLIVPMHIGFVQGGAQNHATAQVTVLGPGETWDVRDAFCIQESQCGFLGRASQRFLMLPLGLRHTALGLRGRKDFSRLWEHLSTFTRRYGIARGGHLERFLRPYFRRMVPYRHAYEPEHGQVGAAWFVGDALSGVEAFASPEHYAELLPVLSIYSYAPAGILHDLEAKEADGPSLPRKLDLLGVRDTGDLLARLAESRAVDERSRIEPLQELSEQPWAVRSETERHGLRIQTVEQGPWLGQVVRDGEQAVYVSLVKAQE